MNAMKRLLILSILMVAATIGLTSQTLRVLDYDVSGYPQVKANVMAFDASGKISSPLDKSTYSIADNSNILDLQYITCSSNPEQKFQSIVLTLDKGVSAGDTSLLYFNLALDLLDTLLNTFDFGTSQIAVTSFDLWSYLVYDFSSDRNKLLTARDLISPAQSSSALSGLRSSPAGGLDIAASGKGERSMVLITQGISDFNPDEIINYAKANNIKIYVVYLSKKITPDYKRITLETGGHYFDNVRPSSDLKPIIYSINALIEGYRPCEFMWYGRQDCLEDHNISITDKLSSAKATFAFVISDTAKPSLFANPPYLEYASVPIGTPMQQEIMIQAVNSDIILSGFSIPSPQFAIVAGNITEPKILYKNSTHNLTIEYTPIDSAIIFTKLLINSSACLGNEIYITGGFPNRPPKTKTIEVVSPECGKTLVIGDTVEVRWQGLLPKDVIQLEYSPDEGANWYALAKNTENLFYTWPIPFIETDKLMVRAIQLWPNNVGRTLDLRHSAAVNSAFFNKIGDRVITAADDSCAVIWNSNNGEKVHILKHEFGVVNFADFDHQGKYVFTACSDGYVRMFDAETGTFVRAYRHDGNSSVVALDINFDGDKIVSVAKDNKVYLWTVSGTLLKQISFGDRPQFATFDHNGTRILVTSDDGLARIYDASGNFIKSIDTKMPGDFIAYSKHGTFNYNSTKIAVTNDINKNAMVFDIASGSRLYTLSHNIDSSNIFINSTSFFFNPDDNTEYILTSGTDNATRRWLASNGSVPKGMDGKDTLHLFREHHKPVQSAVFNFDGSRLLTASWDSTAKIWNLNQRDLQMDTTDCFISIGRAEIDVINMDFDEVLLGDVAIRHQGFIRNKKKFPFNVRSMKIIGGDTNDFQIIDTDYSSFVLDSAELRTLSVRFKPTAAGLRKITLEIIIPNDTLIAEIFGIGVDIGLRASTYLVDFGKIEIDSYSDSTFVPLFTNKSNSNIRIDSVYMIGPDSEHYDFINPHVLPLDLAPEQTMNMKIRFTPEALGRLNGILVVEHSGVSSPSKINLFGEGVPTVFDTISVSGTDISAKPGEYVEYKINIQKETQNGVVGNLSELKAYLTFNSTMLEPIGNFESDVIDGSRRTISFLMPIGNNGSNEFIVKFRTGLGNDSITSLALYDFSPIGASKIHVINTDATFKLLGVCNQGGVRLFEPNSGRITLSQNRPNPFAQSTTIEYQIIEKGATSLIVYDMTGLPIKVVIQESKEPGRYAAVLNASDFATGMYYYVLETPTQRFYKTMQVIK